MKRILFCIDTKLTPRMRYSKRLIVNKRGFDNLVRKLRLLGLMYNSIPIRHGNMNRVAVLMNKVKVVIWKRGINQGDIYTDNYL